MRLSFAVALASLLVACGQPSSPCATITGGRSGVQAQLVFVNVSEGRVAFTFGVSAASNVFDVPAFRIESAAAPDAGGASDVGSLILRFDGASMRNPDGTPSYLGPTTLAPAQEVVREVALLDDANRSMRWRLRLSRAVCPRVATKAYQHGKTGRAQVFVLFGVTSAFTLETSPISRDGALVGTGMQASGVGFAPSSTVTFKIGDQTIWGTTTNPDGTFDTGLFVPNLPPATYTVTASDAAGHSAPAHLRIVP